MDLKFRKLNANEIDVRIGTISYNKPKQKESGVKGASFLLYKDARVDMTLLDEVVGPMNWQRTHEFKDGKLYCSVGIYNDEIKQFIWKEDVGVESNTEAEKGQASDSFKRACFNWGIGRELYTAPFIYLKQSDFDEDLTYLKLFVKEIEYNGDEISKLVLVDNKGVEKYTYGVKTQKKAKNEPKKEEVKPVETPQVEQQTIQAITTDQIAAIVNMGESVVTWCKNKYKVSDLNEMTYQEADELIKKYNAKRGNK